MVDLRAKSPCEDLLPITVGPFTLSEEDLGHLTSLSPYLGKENALSDVLKDAFGAALPGPNRSTGKAGARVLWFGHNQYLLAGPAPREDLAKHAALTDQSDAWAVVRLQGPGADQVLARLIPVDFRAQHFKRGHTARSDLMHMMASITRLGADAFLIMVFRSMAATLVHDLKTAMEGVAARR